MHPQDVLHPLPGAVQPGPAAVRGRAGPARGAGAGACSGVRGTWGQRCPCNTESVQGLVCRSATNGRIFLDRMLEDLIRFQNIRFQCIK